MMSTFHSGVLVPSTRQALVASVTRHYPFYRGFTRITGSRFFQQLTGSGTGIAWAKVYGGYEIAAPLDDYVGKLTYYFGDLDRRVTWACSRIVRPSDVVLDIGANIGLVAFILSALVGSEAALRHHEKATTGA